MNKATKYSQNDAVDITLSAVKELIAQNHIRQCPSCGHMTIKEMPGGRDAVCKNCGYKDPCCAD